MVLLTALKCTKITVDIYLLINLYAELEVNFVTLFPWL